MVQDRNTLIKFASLISLFGNAGLAVAKLTIGFWAGSMAVVGDGIDSSTDVIISIITLITAGIISQPSDREHPYGHSRAETISTVILAFVIFFAGSQLLLSTIEEILEGKIPLPPAPVAIAVTIVSIVGKVILSLTQFAIGKKTGSNMLVANGKNMKNDVIMSTGVLVGLAGTFLFNLPILDRIVAILISFWIFRTAIGIFMETNTELMDGMDDDARYHEIFEAVKAVPEAGNPHRVRLRKLSSYFIADLDIEVEPNMTVRKAHEIAQAVERQIKEKMDNIYDVIVHVEPKGNREEEKFGLKESDLGKKDEKSV